jgi:hypothetical protein
MEGTKGIHFNTRAQVIGRGEQAKREAKKQEESLKKKHEKHENVANDKTCHAMKDNTSTTKNITLDPTLATKGRSEPKLTTSLSDYTERAGENGILGPKPV